MAQSRGVNLIRSDDGCILVFAVLWSVENAKIADVTDAARLRIWHVVSTDGTLETFDFADSTFKTGAITTPYAEMTHRAAENGTYDTGIWTHRITTLTDFEIGEKYVFEISHGDLVREIQYYVQYGDLEGDQYQLL